MPEIPSNAVGITGSTGRITGEHLHITCRRNGKYVDPTEIFLLHKNNAGEMRGGIGGNVNSHNFVSVLESYV